MEKDVGEILKVGRTEYEIQHFNVDTNELKLGKVIVNLPFAFPFFGDNLGWLGWYILISIPSAQIFRKLMGAV